ncbi:MAG TPA: 16S rRNA (adenine(1518)-N(6)/adenine(1519)-N(6))-dimethyltransferase [Ruminococcaceae bacterium]|nr:16S rRNA (adenine(1518)-N(6)/adenine(1519)-N(6))-dimethyltransferase [Oscillospiraceae bacterium]
MELANPIVVKGLLARHGFHFSKSLGQNFLVDSSVCPQMAELSGTDDAVGVLEIGPGIGVLTVELARLFPKVVAMELDQRLFPVLKETLHGFDAVHVVEGDALKADLSELIAREFDGPVVVCANLPYYITSPLLMRLLESRLNITAITAMVQKEAGERICAEPGTRKAGAISLAVHYYAQPQQLFDVPASSFLPRPKVDSCVIRMDVRKKPPIEVKDEKLLFRVIRAAFAQRRKMLRGALSAGLGIAKQDLVGAFQASGVLETKRAEQLTLAEFSALADAIGR